MLERCAGPAQSLASEEEAAALESFKAASVEETLDMEKENIGFSLKKEDPLLQKFRDAGIE